MEIIRGPLANHEHDVTAIPLSVDRLTLAKRRWRGVAEDGREFGFDLAEPLRDGVAFFQIDGATYQIAQRAEPVFEIALATPGEGARIGWLIGNLHFSLDLDGNVIYAPNDSAVRQMLEREQIHFSEVSRVFHPARHGHVH
ncbi:MAG: urease accessory protein UreE [Chthoniobacteraceae bacterium]|jgi:urease accessory protein